jgi:hypothetical protein
MAGSVRTRRSVGLDSTFNGWSVGSEEKNAHLLRLERGD